VTESCEHCAFFEESPKVPNGGFCRRLPPTPVFGLGPDKKLGILGSESPPVEPGGKCGEWRKGTLVKVAKSISPVIPFPGGSVGKN